MMASPRANGSNYDVFLSFRGEDTRYSFTDHLYERLVQAGLRTFRDDDEINRGQELKPEIERAIKTSEASIIVLSENYATSTWCLDELCLILERRRECNHFVLPVFYHVDPSDVRKQTRSFQIENKTSTRWTNDNVKRWNSALTKVADLSGLVLSGSETQFLKKIVDTIYNRLDRKQIYLPLNLTGIDARVEYINSWIKQSDVEFLVICGMGGSGKSTLAQYIVYSNWQYFENISIVERIGSRCKEPHDLLKLQEQLLKDILGGKNARIPSVCQGAFKIEEALRTKKALIVLDDIVKPSQLEALLGVGNNINNESKIIITTTENDLGNWFKSRSRRCQEYKMELLNDDESLELLCLHAFGSKVLMEGYDELAKEIVQYCGGNPLALEVLGSSLSEDNSIAYWGSVVKLLGKDIHQDICSVLKRSYDSLPYDSDRELFLDIACFFIGTDMDYVVKILEPDYSAVSRIKTLVRRCLVYVTPNKKLMMHRLLQDMGRSLVDRKSPKPTERSRVWRNKDSYEMLKHEQTSNMIKGLALDMHMLMEENQFMCKQIKKSSLQTVSLQQMDKLRLLQLNFVELKGSYEDFSGMLRWLCWHGFSERTIPSLLYMRSLVAIDMSYSYLHEFEPPTVLESLKILNLKSSERLSEIRNIYRLPNLENLILWNCGSLVHVCETLGDLKHLAILNMTGCEKLGMRLQTQIKSLATARMVAKNVGVRSTQLSFPFPHSLQRLFLKDWNLGCADDFPLSFSAQSFLQYLNLGNNLFEYLPSYGHLKNLRVLDLSLCSRLKWLLCLPNTLAELYIYYCKALEKVTFESHRFTLQEFGYEGCINLSEVEGFIKLVPLAKHDEADLGHLKWLKAYQNLELCLAGDDELIIGRSRDIQMLYEFNITSTSLPDIQDPNMTPDYISKLTSISFVVPSCPKDRIRLMGLYATFKYTISGDDWAWFVKISTDTGVELMYNPKVFGKPEFGESAVWLSYWPIANKLNVGDTVNVSVIIMSGLEIHECGASLVYADDDKAYETSQNNMECAEVLGGDLSAFQLSTGAYYLCRRDFFALMEVGRLTPGWFSILVGDTVDNTEVRGWRKTGRPQQSYQSFAEVKTVKCIFYGPDVEEIYRIATMSKSSFGDKSVEYTSSIPGEKSNIGTTSEFSNAATKGILDQSPLASHSLRKDTICNVYLSLNDFDTDQFVDHLKCELERAGFHVFHAKETPFIEPVVSGLGKPKDSGSKIQVEWSSDDGYKMTSQILDLQSTLTDQPTKEIADEVKYATYQAVEEGFSENTTKNPNLEDSMDWAVAQLNDMSDKDGYSYSKKRLSTTDLTPLPRKRAPRAQCLVVQTTTEADTADDGYVWRKYGQKGILGGKYPRSYYRCISRYEIGCQATKHVQRASDDPKIITTTYRGQHNHDRPIVKISNDDATVGSGSRIPEQPRAPSQASASIVVLSESYASSGKHLDELLVVLEIKKKTNQFVLPVFFELESSYIKENGKDLLLQKFQGDVDSMTKVDLWHTALTEVANMPGLKFPRMYKHDDKTAAAKEIVSMLQHVSTPIHPTQMDT